MLGHLYAVFIVYVPQYYAVFEGRAAEEYGVDDEQGIEPAARLVDGFGYEVGGEGLVKQIFIFKRIVILRKGHRTRIEPAVDNFGRALHLAAALGAGAG